jgi:aryl-alcohol dehydrogenase-like predicted oxidoreductase
VTAIAGRPVARVGFGAMQLPGPGVFGPPRDRTTALAVLRRAVELGVNHIDTAQYYGPDVANELIRSALHPYPDDLVLVSKVGARRDPEGGWLPWDRPEDLRAGVEANLRGLDVERLDAVNLRCMDGPDEARFADRLATMVALREEGKIAGVGLSNIGLELLRTALATTEIACVQNAFSLVDREHEPVLELCGERGIPFVAFFPLGSAFPGMPKVVEQPAVRAVAERLGATPAQVGLAWLLHRAPHVLLIPGTSSPAHLEENVAAGELTLDAEALTQLGSQT